MENTHKTPFYRTFLRDLIAKRIEQNPVYSIRSGARSLGISAGAFSDILNGGRALSLKMAERIVEALDIDPQTRQEFFSSVVAEQSSRNLQRRDPRLKDMSKSQRNLAPGESKTVDQEVYRSVADWYHAAILELTYREDFQSSPRWIANQLDLPLAKVKLAIERLIDLEMLKTEDGRLSKVTAQLNLKNKGYVTNQALRKKQKEIRELAIQAVDSQPIEARAMSSMTMCIDPSLLPEARRRIEQFTQELCADLESKNRTSVYAFVIDKRENLNHSDEQTVDKCSGRPFQNQAAFFQPFVLEV